MELLSQSTMSREIFNLKHHVGELQNKVGELQNEVGELQNEVRILQRQIPDPDAGAQGTIHFCKIFHIFIVILIMI